MKIIIRLLSILVALIVIATIYLIVSILGKSGLQSFLTNGLVAYLTLIGWVLTIAIGPYASAQLWRMHKNGLWATAILSLYAICYYSIGAYLSHSPDMKAIITSQLGNVACLIFVLSPKARNHCNLEKQPNQEDTPA
jgi:hypothetical protein